MAKKSENFSRAENKIRQEIFSLIKHYLGKGCSAKNVAIDYPPNGTMGDYTVACFLLAKKFKKTPVEIAANLAAGINQTDLIDRVVAAGPYLNFFVNQKLFSQLVLTEVAKAKGNYGKSKIGRGKKVMVEYFSPNTNKPLTIGHVRNICLGSSVVALMNFCSYKVIQSTLYNDRGIAIAKTIVGYLKWGNNESPNQAGLKPDHFVGSFYIRFCQEAKTDPNLDTEAKRVLQQWEEGQKDIFSVWQKLMGWVLEGFKQTLKDLGVSQFDEEYYESEYYKQGKEIVEKGLRQGIFVKDKEGVIFAPLQKYNLADKIVLRPDDTSLYVTQDLYLAYLKDKYQLHRSIYVVGSEQDLYFKQLFKIFELLGFEKARNYYHLSYGMIRLPDGKIKSREGLVKGTGADDLMSQLRNLAKAEISSRDQELNEPEVDKRAGQISKAALKFYILAVSPKSTMIFNPQESVAFNGRTGPYLQYVHARISSIFAKTKEKATTKLDFSAPLDQSEFALVKLLAQFPFVVSRATKEFDPSQLANYLYELAKAFSLFYEKVPVLKAEGGARKIHLLMLNDIKIVLATGLGLLGIEAPEKM